MKVNVQTILMIICFATAYNAMGETPPEGPYFGLTPPGATPQIFAPGRICLPNRFEQDICFSQDGGECYFTIRNAAWTDLRIYVTRYENGAWTTPAQASFSNTHSQGPRLADNDQNMYFNRDVDTWRATRTPTGWSAPVKLGTPLNSPQDDWSCNISDMGNAWVCSWRTGGAGQCDVWRIGYADGNFINQTNFSALNTTYSECNPVSGPDEEYVMFNSNRPGGYGAMDIYISYADANGGWMTPRNLGPPFNTSKADVVPHISPDNKYLFFTRVESATDSNIYWVNLCAVVPPLPDADCDGTVDINDLEIFNNYWLTNQPSMDVAPAEGPDGIIDFKDFAFFAEYWMGEIIE